MGSKSILVVIGGHLSTAPRAQKEAAALTAAGFEVEVAGVWFDPEKIAQDCALMARTGLRFTAALDFRGGDRTLSFQRFQVRLRAAWARKRYVQQGIFSPDLLGYGARALARLALKRSADLTVLHSEAGLWIAQKLLRRGLRVGLDFEDWFSRDLPPEARRERPVAMLEHLESVVARQARYVLAPSQALAAVLARSYNIALPTVVYNSFPEPIPWIDYARSGRPPSLHWFSQNIGRHRGLELLLAALPLLKHPACACLRGACDATTRRWLEQAIPASWRHKIRVEPLVPAEQLAARVAEHDIGLALEDPSIPSRNLSVSNKVFHYLQSGLPVVATPTAGQREVLSRCGSAGMVLPAATPEALAEALDRYLGHPEFRAVAKSAARAAFSRFFSGGKKRKRSWWPRRTMRWPTEGLVSPWSACNLPCHGRLDGSPRASRR